MNILILGAGLMQTPAILSARSLGYKVHVIDADENAVAIPKAHTFKKIDLKDKEGILTYAKELKESPEGLDAVFTAGTDFSASVSYVCEKLGLKAHSFEAATNASIKTQMRKCFLEKNVPSPKFFSVNKEHLHNYEEKSNTLMTDTGVLFSNEHSMTDTGVVSELSFPLVVKPVDNMGARGCRMVRTQEEFLPALQVATQCSRTGNAIVEEYMEGPEYSIDALIYNGTFTVTGFAVRHIKYPPYFIEIGHTMPAVIDEVQRSQLISVFALGASSLGLTCGAAKADIKFTSKGPMIGEIAARLSGGYMSGWTYPYASDLNLTKQGILIASGKEPTELIQNRVSIPYTPSKLCENSPKPYELFEVPCKRTSVERAWMSIPGTVENIENIDDYTDRAIFDTLPRATVEIGSKVDFPRNNVQKCGNIIGVSHERDMAIKATQDAVSNIFITLKPNTQETEDFLSYIENDDEKSFPPSAFGKLTQEQLEQINGAIPANKKVIDFLPNILKSSEYINKQDWNFNTIEQTALKFDKLRAFHPELDAKKFWQAVMRGGIQAAVYISDSISKEKYE